LAPRLRRDVRLSADTPDLVGFVTRVADCGHASYRDLPWRHSRDPYAVLVAEVMLQQTQVSRVETAYEAWLDEFPTIDALAATPLERVLETWQGLGYNRRAVALKRTAEQVVERFGGELPQDEGELRSLPGVGPATAAGVLAFAFDRPAVYLETNVRAVFLHELFADRERVPDSEIAPLVSAAVAVACSLGIGPRQWYFALLDYGAHLKRTIPNPSRRSAHHASQSRFEGSRRQKRARLLRAVMARPGRSAWEYADEISAVERDAGRDAVGVEEAEGILEDLVSDGFLVCQCDRWSVR
jgi:A/G-specific adenine glycosylase